MTATTIDDLARAIRRASRETNKMPRGGRHGTKKGAKGFTRKVKHKNRRDRR